MPVYLIINDLNSDRKWLVLDHAPGQSGWVVKEMGKPAVWSCASQTVWCLPWCHQLRTKAKNQCRLQQWVREVPLSLDGLHLNFQQVSTIPTVIFIQDLSLLTIGPESHDDNSVALSAKGQTLEMNLQPLANANNGGRESITKNMMTVII